MKRFIVVLAITAAVLLACVMLSATAPETASYPAPRYPRYLVKPGLERLMQAARLAVRQPYGRCPLGKVQSGQRVHVFLDYTQDMQVWDALKRAWAERGVEAIGIPSGDIIGLTKDQFTARAKENLLHGYDGWKELGVFMPTYVPFFPADVQQSFGHPITHFVKQAKLVAYLDAHPDIQRFFGFPGGASLVIRAVGPKHASKMLGNWVYEDALEMLNKASQFPGDVWSLVDDRVVKAIPNVAAGAITDPQGTDLAWTVTPEQTRLWAKSTGSSNHVNVYPMATHATWTKGVIRASANHIGYYPTMTVRLDQHGKVVRVEGGGKTGDLFRMLVNHPKMANAKFPTSPEAGYWFLNQDGFATNPKFVRDVDLLSRGAQEFPNLSERNRAGTQHFSFTHPASLQDPKDVAYGKAQHLPVEFQDHTMHMHVYFATVRWKLGDTGEWITIGDKGQVAMFRDPEIRALTAKYGDPDQILRYEWIPEVPGINAPGDTERQYGSDAWKWILSEWTRIQAGTYEHYIEDYQAGGLAITAR